MTCERVAKLRGGQWQLNEFVLPEFGYQVGSGDVSIQDATTRLRLGKSDDFSYSDAQIDDYHADGILGWRPPVQMTLRARFSHPLSLLRGTAGFGFWNDPFGMTKGARRVSWMPNVRLPQAVWFFSASPPSEMPLATGVAGDGWKAATIDASRPLARALLPFAPLGMLACRVPWGYRSVWPMAQSVLKIDEASIATSMDEWHEYRLAWETDGVRFWVDGADIMRSRYSPRGPLGFVAWIDNQYMVATPQGRIEHGVLATDEQYLEITSLEVKTF